MIDHPETIALFEKKEKTKDQRWKAKDEEKKKEEKPVSSKKLMNKKKTA
jgi:hypothetical protein